MPVHPDLDAGTVARRLEIADEGWLRDLEAAGPPPDGLELPAGAELLATLQQLGVAPPDVDVLLHAAPTPGRTPEVWWLLERCAHRAIRNVGRWDEASGPWPELPAAVGVEGRCFWVYVYLAALPFIRRWHQERAIPDPVSWATLADLGRHIARYRRRRGLTGLGRDSIGWLSLHFSGGIYALGRLQFNLYRIRTGPGGPRFWYGEGDPRASEPGFRPGDAVLGMHIPESGALSPEACEDSLSRARTFFPRYFPEHGFRVVICTSWLLDDQLGAYLSPTSNIVRFQSRFEVVPGAFERDDDIFWFVFHQPPDAIDRLHPRSTLERAIVAHVRSGHHWRVRTGWLRLPEAPFRTERAPSRSV